MTWTGKCPSGKLSIPPSLYIVQRLPTCSLAQGSPQPLPTVTLESVLCSGCCGHSSLNSLEDTCFTYLLLFALCISSEFFQRRSQKCRSRAEASERCCDNREWFPSDEDSQSVAFPDFCGVKLGPWLTETSTDLTTNFWVSRGPVLPPFSSLQGIPTTLSFQEQCVN